MKLNSWNWHFWHYFLKKKCVAVSKFWYANNLKNAINIQIGENGTSSLCLSLLWFSFLLYVDCSLPLCRTNWFFGLWGITVERMPLLLWRNHLSWFQVLADFYCMKKIYNSNKNKAACKQRAFKSSNNKRPSFYNSNEELLNVVWPLWSRGFNDIKKSRWYLCEKWSWKLEIVDSEKYDHWFHNTRCF